MDIQTAYNKGLEDAENDIYTKFKNALDGVDGPACANPKMEEMRQTIARLRTSEVETVSDTAPLDFQALDSELEQMITSIILGKRFTSNYCMRKDVYQLMMVFKDLMDKFRELSKTKSNVGKAFHKLLDEKIKILTSK